MKLSKEETQAVLDRVSLFLNELRASDKDKIMSTAEFKKEVLKGLKFANSAPEYFAISANKYNNKTLGEIIFNHYYTIHKNHYSYNLTLEMKSFIITEARTCKTMEELITLTINKFKNSTYEKRK